MATSDYIRTVGRRKTAIARVRLFPDGDGTVKVNNQTVEDYFCVDSVCDEVFLPLKVCDKLKSVTVQSTVCGGGKHGQAGALSHGIARALYKLDPELRLTLKKDGLLTRDPRMKERKKPGQPGARKRFQYSKR